MRTLLVSNDFPPRHGGIQSYLYEFARRLPADEVAVYCPAWEGAADFDRGLDFPVVRHPTSLMLPTPAVARRASELVAELDCHTVWFGASAPLGLLAGRLGAGRYVASTHGHELGWAALPGARSALRSVLGRLAAATYLGEYTRSRLAPLAGGTELVRLPSGVDTELFVPGAGRSDIRRRHRLGDRPVALCVSRLVPRKGQDVLVRGWPEVRRRVPGAVLLLVGTGPYEHRLRRLAGQAGVAADVVFAGAVSAAELPAYYAAGDVFAMPCRTRRGGLDVEGLGIVFLEAAAAGLPVVAGKSGGSPDAVRDGDTGRLVDGRSVGAVAGAVSDLLADPARAAAMGQAGREWMQRDWHWAGLVRRLQTVLTG